MSSANNAPKHAFQAIKRFCLLLCFAVIPLQVASGLWGWSAHRYINAHAAAYLPVQTSFFERFHDYLADHATDPDMDSAPGYYHYIDIDYYAEFFTGELPHDWDEMIAKYGEEIVIQYGTIPWVIETWTDSLTFLMANDQWEGAIQIAAELGHYVADSHEPLHLTLNYNGQNTGNNGIHSRYETAMINQHLDELPLLQATGVYWESLIDSVFGYIGELYPYVERIITADDSARRADPNYGDAYYARLWSELDSISTIAIHRAVLDLASIWYTAWINAGNPTPLKLTSNEIGVKNFRLHAAYPNPFNPVTTLRFDLSQAADVHLAIYDLRGREVARLVDSYMKPGAHQFRWDSRNNLRKDLSSGIYVVRLVTLEYSNSIKIVLLK